MQHVDAASDVHRNATIATWTVSALAASSILGAAFSIPFWVAGARGSLVGSNTMQVRGSCTIAGQIWLLLPAGYQVAKDAFGGALVSEQLSIGADQWRLQRGQASKAEGGDSGRTADLKGATVKVVSYVNGEPRTQLLLLRGFQKIPFGAGV